MIEFMTVIVFMPLIAMAILMASPFILIIAAIAMIVMLALWIGQFVIIIIAVVAMIVMISKVINKSSSK